MSAWSDWRHGYTSDDEYRHVQYKEDRRDRIAEEMENREEETETWNGYHGSFTAPKGTFAKIYNDANKESEMGALEFDL